MPLEGMEEAWHGRRFSVRKFGFSGAKVRDLLSNGCLEDIARDNPDLVFVQIGGNDIVSEDIIRLREQVISIVSDLKELIYFFKDRNIPVLFGEVFNRHNPRGVSFEFYNKVKGRVNRDLGRFMKRNYNYRVLIHFQGFSKRDLFLHDGVHLNSMGYRLYVGEIQRAIDRLV